MQIDLVSYISDILLSLGQTINRKGTKIVTSSNDHTRTYVWISYPHINVYTMDSDTGEYPHVNNKLFNVCSPTFVAEISNFLATR